MELKQLRIFVALAEELHFGRAAEMLHMTQPALSAQLRNLEDHLGVSLVSRTTRRVSLTRTGVAFLPEARATIEQAEKARRTARDAAQERATVLKIAAIDSATAGLLPEVIRTFRRAHADVDVRVEEMLTAPAMRGLERQAFDIAFGRTADHPPRFETRHVRHEPLVAVLPADHPLTAARSIRLDEIAAERLILPSRSHRPILTSVIEAWFATGGFTPRLVQEANERHMIVAMVAAGLGVSITPAWVMSFGGPDVTYRPLQDGPHVDTFARWRRDDLLPTVQAFVDLLPELRS